MLITLVMKLTLSEDCCDADHGAEILTGEFVEVDYKLSFERCINFGYNNNKKRMEVPKNACHQNLKPHSSKHVPLILNLIAE